MKIIKTSQCGKLSAPNDPTLTYNLSIDENNNLYIRVASNITGGLFSTEWLKLEDIQKVIAKAEAPFNAKVFAYLYHSKSANNAGYLAAALRNEGLIESHNKRVRHNIAGDDSAFQKQITKLIKAGKYLPDSLAKTDA